jgi:hypothetical protein
VPDRLVARADAVEHTHGRDRRDAVTDQQDFQTVPKLELAHALARRDERRAARRRFTFAISYFVRRRRQKYFSSSAIFLKRIAAA